MGRITYENYTAARTHPKMPKARRAKIFAPFDALSGFREALAKKEQILVPDVKLTKLQEEELNQKIACLHTGQMVSLIYEQDQERGRLILVTGTVTSINRSAKILSVAGRRIRLQDLRELTFLSEFQDE